MRWCFVIIFSLCCSIGFAKSAKPPLMTADKTWVRAKLVRMGFSKAFVQEVMTSYEPKSFEKTLSLNLLGFLNPPGQHMNQVSPKSVRAAGEFIRENKETFRSAESTYKVSPEVISALLWIETRHGEDTGDFHTASVYMHLLQANLAKNRRPLTKLALRKNKSLGGDMKPGALKKLMAQRTERKAKWAEEQLIALAAARKNKHLNLKELRGSYAGAFGLPQFIPSSYLEYAQSVDDSTPDLQTVEDAIYSVAHYLKIHGWDKSEDAKVNALMKYNNSRDYADSILAISKGVAEGGGTGPGSKTRALSSSGD